MARQPKRIVIPDPPPTSCRHCSGKRGEGMCPDCFRCPVCGCSPTCPKKAALAAAEAPADV